jgi:hypothetical protein
MAKVAPVLESAAVVARTVSGLLRRAGLKVGQTVRGKRTEGFWVYRVGYSGRVSVTYWLPGYRPTPDERERRTKACREAFEVLRARGYPVDDRGYIECGGE